MEIKQLEYFVQIVDCGTFSAAAQKNFITQSALSKIIKKLETELGCDLLYSQGKNTVPTDTGRILYGQAKKILHECNVTISQIEAAKGNPSGDLRISVSGPWNRMTSIYSMITDFVSSYPDVRLQISRQASNVYRESLTGGDTDIAIVCGNHKSESQFEKIPLIKNCYYFIFPKNMKFSASEPINWEDIVDYPLVTFTDTYHLYHTIVDNFHKLGKSPDIRMTSDQPDLLLHVASINGWCTIWGDEPTQEDLQVYNMSSYRMAESHEISLLRRNEAYSSLSEHAFVNFVKNNWDKYNTDNNTKAL